MAQAFVARETCCQEEGSAAGMLTQPALPLEGDCLGRHKEKEADTSFF